MYVPVRYTSIPGIFNWKKIETTQKDPNSVYGNGFSVNTTKEFNYCTWYNCSVDFMETTLCTKDIQYWCYSTTIMLFPRVQVHLRGHVTICSSIQHQLHRYEHSSTVIGNGMVALGYAENGNWDHIKWNHAFLQKRCRTVLS